MTGYPESCPRCGAVLRGRMNNCPNCGVELNPRPHAPAYGMPPPPYRPPPGYGPVTTTGPGDMGAWNAGQVRSPGMVFVLGFVTCGIYQIYWYFTALDELTRAGINPTGHSPWLDFGLAILTCGLWGIFVDYKMCEAIKTLQRARGIQTPSDITIGVVVLDLFGMTLISSVIQQSEMNKLWTR